MSETDGVGLPEGLSVIRNWQVKERFSDEESGTGVSIKIILPSKCRN